MLMGERGKTREVGIMKSELKKLKEEFPDLDHVERFKMGAANWHKKKEEREAVKAKD